MSAGRQVLIVTGIREIDRKLRQLPGRVQKKVVRQAMRAGLKVVMQEVKAQSPVDTGTTRKAVQTRAVKKKKRGAIELEVRILATDMTKRTSARTGKTVFYPAIVEYGHDKTPANPFMLRAFNAKGETARKTTLAHLLAGLNREIRRGGK